MLYSFWHSQAQMDQKRTEEILQVHDAEIRSGSETYYARDCTAFQPPVGFRKVL